MQVTNKPYAEKQPTAFYYWTHKQANKICECKQYQLDLEQKEKNAKQLGILSS